jgi:tRNA A58 N-methylase Trm61
MQRGLILATTLLLVLIFVSIVMTYLTNIFLVPVLMTPKKVVDEIINKMNLKPGDKVYDLGAGDYRVLFSAVTSQKVNVYGYEISPILNYYARFKRFITKNKLGKVSINNESFFKTNLENADHIYCHLNPKALSAIQTKLKEELKEGAKVYSYEYPFEGETPSSVEELSNGIKLYVYTLE